MSAGAASAGSPVGQALMGRRPGDSVEIALPAGAHASLRSLPSRRHAYELAEPSHLLHQPEIQARGQELERWLEDADRSIRA